MSHRLVRPVVLFAIAPFFVGGCTTSSPYHRPSTSVHADSNVAVENAQWEDLTVYVERDGGRLRLGVVPGKEKRTLTIPDAWVAHNSVLRLVAMSTGREPHGTSNFFALDPGSRASWCVGMTGRTTPVSVVPPA